MGRVYLANSLGTLTAPFLVGFLLVPCLGALDAWRWLAVASLLSGIVLTVHVAAARTRPAAVQTAWAVVGLVLVALARRARSCWRRATPARISCGSATC